MKQSKQERTVAWNNLSRQVRDLQEKEHKMQVFLRVLNKEAVIHDGVSSSCKKKFEELCNDIIPNE